MQKLILIAALLLGTAATADTPRPETVAQTLEILATGAYPLSELLYVWNDGAWTVSP
ncbi:hypothetical protein [Octadecabacter sp. R77987]|uniref:hypothetical protein n=1 Tax=Octadecabacter sp. R77987 TaxID=3093874 RepID=UPI00366FA938